MDLHTADVCYFSGVIDGAWYFFDICCPQTGSIQLQYKEADPHLCPKCIVCAQFGRDRQECKYGDKIHVVRSHIQLHKT